ncbi:MAG: 6,7-dimethyl-8-ribityllumazine synthase [bacterium]|nr:6,7-dimethyl-8-ribityllumazine synthase [bacterium]
MLKVIEGDLSAQGIRFGIIVSRFNEFITERLLAGCLDALLRHGAAEENIEVIKVPGAFEIPYAALKVAQKKSHEALICLGAVIRGDTPHFEYISAEVAKGIAKVSLDTGVPLIFGVITADTLEQAIERAGTKAGNKGFQAAMCAIEMARLYQKLAE